MTEEKKKRVYKKRTMTKTRKVPVKHLDNEEPKLNIVYQKKRVLKILEDGHTKTHYHCQMEGGITQHVPKSLF